MTNLFDTHTHYDDQAFDPDRAAVLDALPGEGIRYVVNAASDLESARAGIELSRRYDFFYCAAGIHPHEAKDAPDDLESRLTALCADPKVVALGEIGLDYHYDFSPRERQREIFEEQLRIACKLELPVIIHDREAHADILELLRRYRPAGIVHCFSGSVETARELVAMGFYLGFTGAVTFKNARRALEAAQAIPPERLLLETDCPYMAPEPFRGRRCDSRLLPYTAAVLAQARGVSPQELADRAAQNALEAYRIPG